MRGYTQLFSQARTWITSSVGVRVCVFGGVVSVYIKQWLHLEEWVDGSFYLWESTGCPSTGDENSVLDGKPTTCNFLFCFFYVYESVMLSISLPCQIPNTFSHVFQSNSHLTWAFHQRTKTLGTGSTDWKVDYDSSSIA